MQNHAAMENVRIELDGPFQTGTRGRTISPPMTQEWELSEVVHERRFVTTGRDSGCELSFAWDFEDDGSGTLMTQTISAQGPDEKLAEWDGILKQMELDAPRGMKKLAALLDELSNDRSPS